jgi:hypothetical protein
MDFLNKAKEQLSGNNTGANTNTDMGQQQQQQGGAVNNQNEDYGDKGKASPSLQGFTLPQNGTIVHGRVDANEWVVLQDLISSRRKPDTPWAETPTRKSLMERGGCMRKLLGTYPSSYPFLFNLVLLSAPLSTSSCVRREDEKWKIIKSNLIQCCI